MSSPPESGSAPARRVVLVDDPLFDEHRCAQGPHPERPERLVAARRAVRRCEAEGLTLGRLPPRDATREELARVHTARYLDDLDRADGHAGELDPDTYLSRASVRAARRAAGGAVAAVDAVLTGATRRGLALLRPPGHHATNTRGMGFCLLNNVAVAAAHVLATGLRRVAIVDWDVHHGNGTQDIFYADPRVLYVSLHQYPLFPGTGAASEVGAADGLGFTANVALSAGANDAVYRAAFDRVVLPVLDEYAPELVLVSAGYDAHHRDPLAAMMLSDDGYRVMARELCAVADRHAQGRLVALLEGGYDLDALEASLIATLNAMAPPASSAAATTATDRGHDGEASEPSPVSLRHEADVERALAALRPRWVTL